MELPLIYIKSMEIVDELSTLAPLNWCLDKNTLPYLGFLRTSKFLWYSLPESAFGICLSQVCMRVSNTRDFKQRQRGRRRERHSIRENPKGPLRMTGGELVDVLRSEARFSKDPVT